MENCFNEKEVPSQDVLTLGSLFAKDLPNGIILPAYPSTFDPTAKFYNKGKYIFYDYPQFPENDNKMASIRLSLVAGSELPIMVMDKPTIHHRQHWKRWLPFFPEANVVELDLKAIGQRQCFTRYPLENLPREQHAIDPDEHHRMLSKNTIPEMGAQCPKHMTLDNYTVPCIIKTTHGSSGKGTHFAETRQEAEEIINEMKDKLMCPEPSISEVITELTGNYTPQFYLSKLGDVTWLGCTNQDIGDKFAWNGAFANWNEQDELKEKLYDTVMPVKEYLHKNGYFGFVGIDVLSNKDGNFVVDVNARINGCTPLLMIMPHMARKGFPMSRIFTVSLKCSEVELIEKFDSINAEGNEMVINLASVETEIGKCDADVCIFAKNEESLIELYQRISSFDHV